jgi:hypothetical protein
MICFSSNYGKLRNSEVSPRVLIILFDSNSIVLEPKSLNHYSGTACMFKHSILGWSLGGKMD